MFQNVENLKLLRIVRIAHSNFTQPVHVVDRPNHFFRLKISGECSYTFKNQTLHFKAGDLIYVPQGSTYTSRGLSEKGESLYIYFEATIPNAVPQKHSLEGFPDLNFLYDHLEQMWLFNRRADYYKCHAIFYNLVSFVSTKIAAQYAYQKKLHLISPALEYLQAHIFDCDLKINQLYSLCGLSDTYFRNIFKANFGIAPQEYIINTRMARALNYISSNQYSSIREISLSVGYKDTLYFSRLFSKIHGVSPSRYLADSSL